MYHDIQPFKNNYADARAQFMTVLAKKNCEVTSFRHPQNGSSNEPLCLDVAWIGSREAKNVLVSSSGTHGVEGIMGSGIQIAALESGLYDQLPKNSAVLLIHAINPWGFSWLRRANEDGVDLFRNFINFDHIPVHNPLYDKVLDTVLVPPRCNILTDIKANATLLKYAMQYGSQTVKQAIAEGQFKHAHGPFFGGFSPTWSNRQLTEIIKSYLTCAQHVVAIDYHSGLGRSGDGELIGFDKPDEASYRIARQYWGENYVSSYSNKSVAYEINGAFPNIYKNLLPSSQLIFAAHEFGTCSQRRVLRALRADHWLYSHGDPNSREAEKIRKEVKTAFFRENHHWQQSVFKQAAAAERNVISAFAREVT